MTAFFKCFVVPMFVLFVLSCGAASILFFAGESQNWQQKAVLCLVSVAVLFSFLGGHYCAIYYVSYCEKKQPSRIKTFFILLAAYAPIAFLCSIAFLGYLPQKNINSFYELMAILALLILLMAFSNCLLASGSKVYCGKCRIKGILIGEESFEVENPDKDQYISTEYPPACYNTVYTYRCPKCNQTWRV